MAPGDSRAAAPGLRGFRDGSPNGDRDLTGIPTPRGRPVTGQVMGVSAGLGPQGMLVVILAIGLVVVVLLVAGGAGSLLMTVVGKDVIGGSRPPLADAIPPFEFSPSFPSGHTLNATVIFGVLAYLLIL